MSKEQTALERMTSKEFIQQELGKKCVFSLDGQIVGDLNANDLSELMDRFTSIAVDKRATDFIETLKTKLARNWDKKTGDQIYDLIDETFFYTAEPHMSVTDTQRYARECCQATQKKIAENAKVTFKLDQTLRFAERDSIEIDKSSITNKDNICIL